MAYKFIRDNNCNLKSLMTESPHIAHEIVQVTTYLGLAARGLAFRNSELAALSGKSVFTGEHKPSAFEHASLEDLLPQQERWKTRYFVVSVQQSIRSAWQRPTVLPLEVEGSLILHDHAAREIVLKCEDEEDVELAKEYLRTREELNYDPEKSFQYLHDRDKSSPVHVWRRVMKDNRVFYPYNMPGRYTMDDRYSMWITTCLRKGMHRFYTQVNEEDLVSILRNDKPSLIEACKKYTNHGVRHKILERMIDLGIPSDLVSLYGANEVSSNDDTRKRKREHLSTAQETDSGKGKGENNLVMIRTRRG